MNLLFLVEGGKTEPNVYKAWLQHLFPNLNFVVRPEDMTINTCRIVFIALLETCAQRYKTFL